MRKSLSSRSEAEPKCRSKRRKIDKVEPMKWTNPHKKLAESRRTKQSMSCFFGRRAGKPNANIRKPPIGNAEAKKA